MNFYRLSDFNAVQHFLVLNDAAMHQIRLNFFSKFGIMTFRLMKIKKY